MISFTQETEQTRWYNMETHPIMENGIHSVDVLTYGFLRFDNGDPDMFCFAIGYVLYSFVLHSSSETAPRWYVAPFGSHQADGATYQPRYWSYLPDAPRLPSDDVFTETETPVNTADTHQEAIKPDLVLDNKAVSVDQQTHDPYYHSDVCSCMTCSYAVSLRYDLPKRITTG